MYATGLGIAHVGFAIFGVVGGIGVVKGVGRAEENAFAIFGIVGGIEVVEGIDAGGIVGAEKIAWRMVVGADNTWLGAEVASAVESDVTGGVSVSVKARISVGVGARISVGVRECVFAGVGECVIARTAALVANLEKGYF